MRDFSLSHLPDAALLQNLSDLVARDRMTTADLLAHIAEVDARQLYAEAGYSSMFTFCTRELHLSEDAAGKRIQAGRAARKFPALLAALDQGKIHLAGMCILAPHLTEDNVHTLIAAAVHKKRTEIEAWLVANSITPPVAARPCVIKPIVVASEQTPQPDGGLFSTSIARLEQTPSGKNLDEEAPGDVDVSSDMSFQHAPGHVEVSPNFASPQTPEDLEVSRPQVPPAPEHYRMQVVIPKGMHDKLRHAQALMSHAVPSGDVVKVLDRALDLLITHLERRKIGAKDRSNPRSERTTAKHYVPARVRRAVWERDQGQCTFVSAGGNRCGARRLLEYDHVEPLARGGESTMPNVRLRCRTHNQCEARRAFGSGFMRRKRFEGGRSMEP